MPNLPYSFYALKDASGGALNGAVSAAALTCVLQAGDGAKFPAAKFCVRMDDEIVWVGQRTGDTLAQLERGFNGSKAAAHPDYTVVYQSLEGFVIAVVKRLCAVLAYHTHNKAGIPDFAHEHAQSEIADLVSDLGSLTSSLAGKSDVGHGHAIGAITNLQASLDAKCATDDSRLSDARTPTTHNHDAAYEPKNTNLQAHVASAHAPSTAEQNVNADWNAGSGDAQILNKPDLSALHARQHSITSAPDHTFPGGTSTYLRSDGQFAAPGAQIAAPFTGSQAPGSFTIADGQFGLHGKRLILSGSQRATIEGTGRLSLCG